MTFVAATTQRRYLTLYRPLPPSPDTVQQQSPGPKPRPAVDLKAGSAVNSDVRSAVDLDAGSAPDSAVNVDARPAVDLDAKVSC
jgi:hypothetical protein